jgi:2-keto-4-pentenoate hydratase
MDSLDRPGTARHKVSADACAPAPVLATEWMATARAAKGVRLLAGSSVRLVAWDAEQLPDVPPHTSELLVA